MQYNKTIPSPLPFFKVFPWALRSLDWFWCPVGPASSCPTAVGHFPSPGNPNNNNNIADRKSQWKKPKIPANYGRANTRKIFTRFGGMAKKECGDGQNDEKNEENEKNAKNVNQIKKDELVR
jgi:hypothetical protein